MGRYIDKMVFKNVNLKGFMLAEIVIVIAVVAILCAVAFMNFSSVLSQLALNRAAHQIAQDIRKVQEMAISVSKPADLIDPFEGYGIYFDVQSCAGAGSCSSPSNNLGYIVYADTSDYNGAYGYYDPGHDYIISEDSIQEKMVYIKEINQVENNKVSIDFTPPNPTVTLTELALDQNTVQIVLALIGDPSITKSIYFNKVGALGVE